MIRMKNWDLLTDEKRLELVKEYTPFTNVPSISIPLSKTKWKDVGEHTKKALNEGLEKIY